jgi:hypothetical protein
MSSKLMNTKEVVRYLDIILREIIHRTDNERSLRK